MYHTTYHFCSLLHGCSAAHSELISIPQASFELKRQSDALLTSSDSTHIRFCYAKYSILTTWPYWLSSFIVICKKNYIWLPCMNCIFDLFACDLTNIRKHRIIPSPPIPTPQHPESNNIHFGFYIHGFYFDSLTDDCN